MANAVDVFGCAFKNASATCLARIAGNDGERLTPNHIVSIIYSIYLLDDHDPDSRTAIANHSAVTLTPADVLFEELQTDSQWMVDAVGYNFRHVLDVSAHPAFAVAGRRYLIEYILTPADGQDIHARFRVNVV